MADNPGPTLIRALNLPLRDVHDICATGDVDYLRAFAEDEHRRQDKGLGAAHSVSRKATSPVRRAEYLQGSKIAQQQKEAAEAKEMAARLKKREENKRRRREEAAALAREEAGDVSEVGTQDGDEDAAAGGGAYAGYDAQDDEEEEQQENDNAASGANPALLMSIGAGSTDADRVPVDTVFPRPPLGRSAAASTDEAIFNTVGLGVVAVAELVAFRDEHGFLPIHTAAVFGNSAVIDFLLEHGADIESETARESYRPLHLAVMNGHDQLARRLVEVYSADPGALTKKFELPQTLARYRRVNADLQIYFKQKCLERIKSADALQAANDGDILFFAHHIECDEDGGRKTFVEDYLAARPGSRDGQPRPGSAGGAASAGGSGVTVSALMRDAVTTPLDIAIACIQPRTQHLRIAEMLIRGNFYNLNEARESTTGMPTTLYLAVTIPCREAVRLLLDAGADPRVGSVFNAAPQSQTVLRNMLAEAEAKVVFEEFYATRNEVPAAYEERQEFTQKVLELRDKWRKAQRTLVRAQNREEAIAAAEAASQAVAE